MNDDFLKNMGGGLYWKELLERIRDIRTSEKVMYQQVLDLYATSLDYDATMPETLEFFKVVQNKLHYAVSGHTASEIVFNRANAELPFMGLTVFKGSRPVKSEVTVATRGTDFSFGKDFCGALLLGPIGVLSASWQVTWRQQYSTLSRCNRLGLE